MIKLFVFTFLLPLTAKAYIPTVESLFRHGGNPEISANTVSLTLEVKKLNHGEEKDGGLFQDVALVKEKKSADYYRIFFTQAEEGVVRLAQTRYSNKTFSEGSLEHKIYYPNFGSNTIRPSIEHVEKGLFFSALFSIALNRGDHLINYLKSLGVPVKLNEELLNRDKVELLANYKRYLVLISKDRNAKKTAVNPLHPEDKESKEKVNEIMGQPMYLDMGQVRLGKDNGEMAWLVSADQFEASVSYKNRHIRKLKYKTEAGEFEIQCQDYWLASGTHFMPKTMLIKGLNGESYQISVLNLRHFNEKEEALLNRIKKWDSLLDAKGPSSLRPEFML